MQRYAAAIMHGIWDIILRVYARRRQGYTERLEERHGDIPLWPRTTARRYWIHAASLGEMRLAVYLEHMIRGIDASVECVITSMTPSGSAYCRRYSQACHYYAPYDTPYAVSRFLDAMAPDALFLIETELWPCTLSAVHKKNIPIHVMNGRLGKNSRRLHRLLRYVWPFIRYVTSVAAMSDDDALFFQQCGIREVKALGQMKWCVPPQIADISLPYACAAWCLMFASVQWGEYAIIKETYYTLRKRGIVFQMIIAPRRLETLPQWLQGWSSETVVVTAQQWRGAWADIIIVDTYGDLDTYYKCADVVYVGGSLVPHGGQNVLEPAYHGKCVITGPYDYNFAEVIAKMKSANCIIQISDATALIDCLYMLYDQPHYVQEQGMRAAAFCAMLQNETMQAYEQWLRLLMEKTYEKNNVSHTAL